MKWCEVPTAGSTTDIPVSLMFQQSTGWLLTLNSLLFFCLLCWWHWIFTVALINEWAIKIDPYNLFQKHLVNVCILDSQNFWKQESFSFVTTHTHRLSHTCTPLYILNCMTSGSQWWYSTASMFSLFFPFLLDFYSSRPSTSPPSVKLPLMPPTRSYCLFPTSYNSFSVGSW